MKLSAVNRLGIACIVALVSPLCGAAQSTVKPIVVRRAPATPVTPTSTAAAPPATAPGSAVPTAEQGSAQLQSTLNERAIALVLAQQVTDWNRGDLEAFARGYKHAPDILFIGNGNVRRGYDGMLQRYKESYPTRERMGTLAFSGIEVQPLGPQFATATGRFHLERTAAGGGNANGSFLLVLEQTTEGWKVVRDDTTAATK